MIELESVYNPESYEPEILAFWAKAGSFNANANSSRPAYTILMPPPNVTSQLHMGHGTGYTIQDILIRWQRMRGYEACWLPGTDHAGIATQMMVERALADAGLSRKEIGRDAFEQRLREWKDKYGGIILDQLRRLGFSCDWDRVAYTMDPGPSAAVRHVFVRLYEEGLIYRGERLVNWDTALQTALSDDEVENIEIQGALYSIRYPLSDGSGDIVVATTRPETMFGDVAIAVNPEDPRYKDLIGKDFTLPLSGRKIPLIGDSYVKMDFGTGALKITPAHDPNDFEIGKRHQLPALTIMDDSGRLYGAEVPERFRGLERAEARKAVVKALKETEALVEEKSYRHTVPHSERSKTVIEPKLSRQWFVRMASLAEPAAAAARDGTLNFYPESWRKTYLYWLDNIQDWCISRQLWWGHRIPIWDCSACGATTTGIADPHSCSSCGSTGIKQDEDVLDTWFSSWLWPLSPFGWPHEDSESKANLAKFYPSQVLVTAPEIIFLWVARMIMAGLKFTGKVPFKDIYFNATVCDKKGRKFSKTLGNGIDPLDVIAKHGADAVRFTATSLAPLGGRLRMELSDFEQGSRFVNKLWNASRFLLRQLESGTVFQPLADLNPNLAEHWLLSEFHNTTIKVNHLLESYRLNEAVDTLYHFIWGSYCDWGLECAKESLGSTANESKATTLNILCYVLNGILRLAHPVIPFVTEKIWQALPPHPNWDRPNSLAVAAFPDAKEIPFFPAKANDWALIQKIISGIRSARQQSGLASSLALAAHIRADDRTCALIANAQGSVCRIANVASLHLGSDLLKPARSICFVGPGFELYLPVEGLLDVSKERARLAAEAQRLSKIVHGLQAKLGNAEFMHNAPAEIQDQTRTQHAKMSEQLTSVQVNLDSLL